MRRKKVLMCTEASYLPTGYAVYSKEVLSRLHKNKNLEIAELGCYSNGTEPEARAIPWKFYPNKPPTGGEEWNIYKSTPVNEFGEYRFNDILIDFMPDFVMDIRDWWMIEYQQRSPFRNFYNWAIMPTVDAEPQNAEWVQTYGDANAVFTYSEFGRDTLLKQYNGANFRGLAPPCASDSFCPVKDKFEHRKFFGIDENALIFGTVMRNQRRKLFPDLFKSFRKFLDQSGNSQTLLYCHTSYPDVGWSIPDLLNKYNLQNRVLFSYKCKGCGHISSAFFSDVLSFCHNCNTFNNVIVGVNNPISEKELAAIYNLFDLYIQYANSEGFGMPQLEAAQCGVEVASVDYSAMSSVVKNIGATPLPVASYSQECETGCHRAVPDNKALVDLMAATASHPRRYLIKKGMELRERAMSYYNWDKTAAVWEEYFMNTPVIDQQLTWLSGSRNFSPTPQLPSKDIPIKEQVNYLFHNVLGIPEWIGGQLWRRLIKDLTYQATAANSNNGFYFNESHLKDKMNFDKFNLQDAYNRILELRKSYNQCDHVRMEKVQSLKQSGDLNV
jgi:glycosyltransferase involved in cell wall biosynthesis